MADLPLNPQSNVEKLLSVIAGEDTELPEDIQSRVEQYLHYFIENGVSIGGGGSGDGSGGTTNYTALSNKPRINGVTLTGNKTTADLNIPETMPDATLTQKGLVQLSNDTASDDQSKAATPYAVKQAMTSLAVSVESLPAGSAPTVTKTTENGVNKLAFGIPKGDTGASGNDGYSPSASVTKTGDTATISVRDKTGSSSVTVKDGKDGADGKSATVSIGSVTSGTVPSVTNSGTGSDAVLNFVLAKGDKGDTGSTGPKGEDGKSFTIQAMYATEAALRSAHPTGQAGDAYIIGTAENNNVYIWDTEAQDWTNVGPIKGVKGDKGDTGEEGFTPTLTATVIEGGVRLTITNSDGTQNVEIQNGTDGKDGKDGANGSDGFSPTATVSKSGDTVTISITDKDGTTTATVKDGKDGVAGEDGKDASINGVNALTLTADNGVSASQNGSTLTISGANASTSQKGVVQLSSATDSTDETKAATPAAVKAVKDASVPTTRTINDKSLSANVTLTGSDIAVSGTDSRTVEEALADTEDSEEALNPPVTASGDMVTFTSEAAGNPINPLVAHIEPVQDFNGYDRPWVGGAGKNLLELTASTQTLSGVTFTVDKAAGTVTVSGTNTGSSTLWFNVHNAIEVPAVKFSGCPDGGSDSTYQLSATVDGTRKDRFNSSEVDISAASSCRVSIGIRSGYTASGLVFKPMLRLASDTDATFAPYANICPITGWNSVTVTRAGKNLLPLYADGYSRNDVMNVTATISGGAIRISGTASSNGGRTRYLGPAFTLPAGDYYLFSNPDTVAIPSLTNLDTNTGLVTTKAGAQFHLDTATNVQFGITVSNGTVYNETMYPMLVSGSEASNFAPYAGQSVTISLADAGTVYGGTLDVASGKLTVTHKRVDLDTLTGWTRESSASDGDYVYANAPTDTLAVRSDGGVPYLSSHYVYSSTWISMKTPGLLCLNTRHMSNLKRVFVSVDPDVIASASDWTAWLTAQKNAGTPVQLVYELASPVTYQLTPQEVTTLLGTNHVYADCGSVDVTYRAGSAGLHSVATLADLEPLKARITALESAVISLGGNI